jgi:aryl-alcohol dehydrogenase-like predicted oxidoreductase
MGSPKSANLVLMQLRRFGSTDLTVSELGMGCARIGGVFQGTSRRDLVTLLRRAFDEGITFFDTADMYTQGESESVVGEAFLGKRDRVVIATKGGYVLPTQKNLVQHIKPLVRPLVSRLGLKRRLVHASVRGTVAQQDFSPAHLVHAVEGSLRRLRTDYIDLYQLHAPSLDVLRRDDYVEPLERLRDQGKIRHWGVAGDGPEHMLAALARPRVEAVQVALNVLEQAALDQAIPCAAAREVAVIARQVFASGLLTRATEAVTLDELDSNPDIARCKYEQLAAYSAIAGQTGRSPAELAVQFSLAQHGVSVVLVGISRQAQLDEVLRASNAPALSREESDLLLALRRPPVTPR